MARLTLKLADRLILRPTRHHIDDSGKSRQMVPFRDGYVEVWTQRVGTYDLDEVDIFVLKFPGAAGRAERSTYHPMDCWSDLRAELWSVNPPGYGGSSGSASLQDLVPAARAAFRELARVADGRPIMAMGNSLGSAIALRLAATEEVAALVLRNPPPLRRLVVGRHGWWNGWIGAALIARQIPHGLCSIQNASMSTCPAVFISSQKDRTVPAVYQRRVTQVYAGPHRLLSLEHADHATSMSLEEQRLYRRHLDWLRKKIVPAQLPQLVAGG